MTLYLIFVFTPQLFNRIVEHYTKHAILVVDLSLDLRWCERYI